jgi:hypothetical protein
MGKSIERPRSGLRNRRHFQAGFGARHPIVYDEGVARFFRELGNRWSAILPEREPGDRALTGMPERRYVLYNNPEKIGMSVLERRLSAEHARRHRLQWTPNDIGRLRGQISNELARMAVGVSITDDELEVPLENVVRVGDADRGGGKFALTPEASHPVSGFLAEEHEIIVDGLGGVFKNFRYPYDDYVPKMTIGRVYRGACPDQIQACATELEGLTREMPLTVTLDPIIFFAHQEL